MKRRLVGVVLCGLGWTSLFAAVPTVLAPPLSATERAVELEPPKEGRPFRVGHPLKLHVTSRSAGVWERQADGSQLWRVKLRSPGASWLMLGFGVFRPIAGAELWVSAPDNNHRLGPFTANDVQPHGQLWVGPLPGDSAAIELRWPASAVAVDPNIELNVLSHGFRGFGDALDKRLGDSGSCNIDIACPLGAAWQDEKRGVVMYLKSGSDWCSGSLINNTAQNCKPLVLTAAHCMSTQGELNQMTFVFNFERSACGSGGASTAQQIAGGSLRASSSPSDFTLIELNQAVPDAWTPYYNGWNRADVPATQVTGVHHPSGDAKKISRDDSGTVAGSHYGPNHWRVPSWDQGVTEGGSSGSPLFDQNSRIIGQLHGGESSCSLRTWDEYGKFAVSWNGGGSSSTRLRDWLDPANTSVTTLDGLNYSVCALPHADLKYDSHSIDDTSGNANGFADPGETFLLPVTIRNLGNTAASGVTGTIGTIASGVSILDGNAAWPDVPMSLTRGSTAPHFQLQLAESLTCGALIPITLNNSAANPAGSWSSNFDLRIGQPQLNTAFQDAIEAGVGGWTQQALQGANSWSIVTTDFNSATHSWFVNDVDLRTDSVLVMQTLNNLPANAELQFFHKFRTEGTWDGGVLEYQSDGGAWVDAGPLITEGAYSGAIGSSAGSNLAGRSAWTGDSASWLSVRVDLASLAGHNVRFRWRFATDISVASTGWWIDDVKVTSTSYNCAPVATVPGEASGAGTAAFKLMKVAGGFQLDWSAPLTGGTPTRYKLYRYALPLSAATTPTCEADLGTSTSATLATLTSNMGFVVVARNGAGEGSYGKRSSGVERTKAVGGAVCP